jgi:hypothetical protein
MAVYATDLSTIRICPGCRRSALRPVIGGLGKMGCCARCGYTGPLANEDEDEEESAPADEERLAEGA